MSDMNKNDQLVEEAKSILEGLRHHQKTATDRLSNMDKQIEDLKVAQRKMAEAYTTKAPDYTGKVEQLKSFVREDGTLQLRSAEKRINIPGMGTVTTKSEGLLDSKAPVNEWHAQLQDITRKRNFARMLMADPHTPKMDLQLYKHLQVAPKVLAPAIKRAYDGTAGDGAEWTQAAFLEDLYQTFQLPKKLRSLLPTIEVDRGSLIVPRLSRGGRPYVQGVASDDINASAYPASTVATAQETISMAGLTTRYVIDQATMEDSALALAQIMGRQIINDIEDGFEDCMINGDTNAPHQDDIANWDIRGRWGPIASGTPTDHRKAFLGFRAASKDKGTGDLPASAAALVFADIVKCLAIMNAELAADDRVMIVSPEVMVKHLLAISELVSIDSFGPQATLLQGQVGSLLGMPVVMSRFMPSDLNGTGLYDNVTKDFTAFCIYNRSSYYQYQRRGLQVESQRNIGAGAMEIVASLRAVMASPDAAAEKNVATIVGIDN